MQYVKYTCCSALTSLSTRFQAKIRSGPSKGVFFCLFFSAEQLYTVEMHLGYRKKIFWGLVITAFK